MKDYIDKLRSMGYKVDLVIEGYKDNGYTHEDGTTSPPQSCPTTYSISGFGIDNLHLSDEDETSWKRLSDPDAHQWRIDQVRNSDPEDKFEMSDDEMMERNLALAIKFGDITDKQAEEARKEREANRDA